MAAKIWHHFTFDPEPRREQEREEWEKFAQEWEEQHAHWINGDDPYGYFDERSPA